VDAAGWDERYADRDLVWSATPNRTVEAQVEGLPPGRALDLAAGEGRNAIWLAEQGWRVTALDFSPVGADKGRQVAAVRGVDVAWVVADATTWDPPEAGFDLVVVAYLQLPEAERRAAHERAARAVAPGGRFLLVAHDRDNLAHGYGGPPDDRVLMTAADVVDDLRGSGLEVINAERIERHVETEDGPRTALDCLVVATRPDA
jgi:ubiquinone/menaquinone biosynthesis C-methylase UbiE